MKKQIKIKASQLSNFPKKRAKKFSLFAVLPILPQLLIIALSLGVYYAMIHYYLFFPWGIYLYYALKMIIAYAILSAAFRSLIVPLGSLLLGLAALFTNNLYINMLMSTDSAWALVALGLVGLLISLFVRKQI
jgi:hypothetical protein